jgi:hypothetical protein
MASDLRHGKSFAITRLITLKSFCDDPDAATQFAVFLAQQAQAALEQKPRPDYTQQSGGPPTVTWLPRRCVP